MKSKVSSYFCSVELEVLYEDEYCLAVNKPHNQIVHHSKYVGKSDELSLIEVVRVNYPDSVLIHRLDNKTAGIVLIAKSARYVSEFQQVWAEAHLCSKRYLALVRGHIRDAGSMTSPVKNERGNYKEAQTNFTPILCIQRPFEIQPYSSARYSLVEFTPITGRWHQIRIHANKMAHPIIGDPKHGNRHHNHFFKDVLGEERLFLQAYLLQIQHPFYNREITIQCTLSEVFSRFLNEEELLVLKKYISL